METEIKLNDELKDKNQRVASILIGVLASLIMITIISVIVLNAS